jgi:hypothetical protein
MSKNVRGRLYIDRDVQRALVWQLFRHWAIFLAILTGVLLTLEALSAGPNQSFRSYLQATWTRYAPLFLVVVALFPAFAYDSIKLSHRFVGPIIRLRRAMLQAALGQSFRPLKFRKNDFWQDVALAFNALVEKLPNERARERPAASERKRELALSVAGESDDDSRGY